MKQILSAPQHIEREKSSVVAEIVQGLCCGDEVLATGRLFRSWWSGYRENSVNHQRL